MNMRSRPYFSAGLLIALLAGVFCSQASAQAEEPKRVYAGVYLHDVSKFEQKDGVFDADFELWVKWRGEFDTNQITLSNASEVERVLIGEDEDGDWHTRRWRVRGTLRGEFPVQQFPFDQQKLAVELELPERYGKLVPDLAGSGMREHFSVTGWLYKPTFTPRVYQEIYSSDLGSITGEGLPTKIGKVALEVTLQRPLITAATKLFLPLLVILLVAFVALFIHPKELGVRASVGVTALLACYAFHFAVAGSMPNVSYITLAEKLFLVSYALCAALLCVSVAAKSMHEHGNTNVHKQLDRVVLFAFPLVLVGTGFMAAPARQASEEPVVYEDTSLRPESNRAILRIGTEGLSRPSGGLISRATSWGTTRTIPGEETFPVLVREVPGITNGSLKFLADGSLEVTWRLLPGLKWSDGEPLTSKDLELAVKAENDPQVRDTRIVSDEEFVVHYHDRVAAALEEISPIPAHFMTDAFDRGGYNEIRKVRDSEITPTAGAYRITEFIKDEKLVMEANPFFAGRAPSISRIEIYCFKPEAELVAAFERGDIDMIEPNAITPEAAQKLAQKLPETVNIAPSDLLLFLHPDLNHPLLAQTAVRRALLQALDREQLRNEIFGESAQSAPVAHVPVPGDLPEGTVKTAYNPQRAKAELERLGATGVSIQLKHGNTRFDREVVARLVQYAAEVGITLVPKEEEDISQAYRDPNHGGLLMITRTGLREDDPEKWWAVPRSGRTYDRSFRSEAFDDDIASLAGREDRALYPERREQIRDKLYAEFSRRTPILPLCFLADRTVVNPALEDWNVGSGKTFGMNIDRWYFAGAVLPEAEVEETP